MMIKIVPIWLKRFFFLHFIIDIVSATLLFLYPEILEILGWRTIDPIATRAVAAALFAIGIESFLCQIDSLQVFYSMLRLKVIWSFFAIVAAIIGVISYKNATPIGVYLMLAVFAAFHFLWIYWLITIKRLLR